MACAINLQMYYIGFQSYPGFYEYTFDDGSTKLNVPESFEEIGTRVWDECVLMSKFIEYKGIDNLDGAHVLEIGCRFTSDLSYLMQVLLYSSTCIFFT